LRWIFVEKESSRTGWNIMIDFNNLSESNQLLFSFKLNSLTYIVPIRERYGMFCDQIGLP